MFWVAQELAQLPVEMILTVVRKSKAVTPQELLFAFVIALNVEPSQDAILKIKTECVLEFNVLLQLPIATEMESMTVDRAKFAV